MIAISKEKPNDVVPAWHHDFLKLLPAIRRHASIAFRNLDPEAKEEAVQEVTCNAMRAYVRLVELGKTDIAYASVLARYGIRQTRVGRKVGNKLSARDVLSRYAQRKQGFRVDSLDHYDREEMGWREIVVEDKYSGPDVIAATRIDFNDWLNSLTDRERKVATTLATGESTGAVAKMIGVSAGRISQLRRELMETWDAFTAEKISVSPTPATA